MLSVFYGDRFQSRELSKQFVAACKKKRPDAEYLVVSPSAACQSLEELLFGQGLFERKYIVFCDEIVSDASCSGYLLKNLAAYSASPHMFIIFEPNLATAAEKRFTGVGAIMHKSPVRRERSDSRRLFSFTDTFLRGKTEATFASLHTLLSDGESPDSVIQIILWQLRTLAVVDRSESAEAAGVKPFVYKKSRDALDAMKKGRVDPFDLFLRSEESVRTGRLAGLSDEEIAERLVLTVG